MTTSRRLVLSIMFSTSPLLATTTRQMSFEEVATGADGVILGTVLESPCTGKLDALGKRVVREHRIRVERYLKGDGEGTITVVTLGGQIEVQTPDGPAVRDVTYTGHPQLPEEGSEVLLFLERYGSGPDTYLIYSASHGVVSVQAAPDGTRWVSLAFRDPDVMPSGPRADFDRAQRAGYSGKGEVFRGNVTTDDLGHLMERVLGDLQGDG
jgi:hypothetical protein